MIHQRQTQFFVQVLEELGYSAPSYTHAGFVRIESRQISIESDPASPSEDRISLLLIHDRPVASALNRRDPMNRCYVTFAIYLTSAIKEQLIQTRPEPTNPD